MIVLWEYPDQGLTRRYQDHALYMEVEAGQKKLRPLDVAWRVSVAFLQHFFTDVF